MNALVRLSALLACVGCSARETCHVESSSGEGVELSGTVASGPSTLVAAGAAEIVRFEATLSGLPELWDSDSAIPESSSQVQFSVAYESPLAGGAQSEMPRVRVTVNPPYYDNESSFITSSFPPAQGDRVPGGLFEICEDDERTNCCRFGSRECKSNVTVQIERLDGSPFPAIVVDWIITARANVSTCPLGGGSPALSLRREAP